MKIPFSRTYKNKVMKIKAMKSSFFYEYQFKNQEYTISIRKRGLKNPKLVCDHGEVDAHIKKDYKRYYFTFGIQSLPEIDGIASRLFIEDNGIKKNLVSFKSSNRANYARTYGILYGENHVYYLRNTASKVGRLMIQKKVRTHFENEDYEKRVEEIYQRTLDNPQNNILFYEKFGSKFEESASKVFEQLYEHPNVYFVLDRYSDQYDEIKAKYGDKIVSPDEDKFIELIFTSNYYIGTEVPFHMVSLRTPYTRYRVEMLKVKTHKFIFLQHGVMYALSLKPASRNSFKKNGIHAPHKVVVSSDLEAKHLKELGNFKDEDLWKTGLASFDNNRINNDATKITVMLTWRPWDEQKNNLEETTYYQAVKSIVESIEDKTNLQVVFHPKVLEKISEDNELLKYKLDGLISDALNETKILISDYSSVTFDAFYRGSNVIFWWVEKEECLEAYNNHLMLNEDNIFGDIVYNNNQLNEVIKNNKCPQQDKYIQNYRKIVEFYDDCNTSRIVEKIKQEVFRGEE